MHISVLVFLLIIIPRILAGQSVEYAVVVNYDQALTEMITAGKYQGELGAIRHFTAENFPICEDGKETVVVTLYSLDDVRNTLGIQIFHTDHITTSMFLDGLRPATLAELLALGEQYPYLQLQYNIVAFGSLWVNTYRYVPMLTSASGKTERILSITHFSQSWFDQYRFAAVQIHN